MLCKIHTTEQKNRENIKGLNQENVPFSSSSTSHKVGTRPCLPLRRIPSFLSVQFWELRRSVFGLLGEKCYPIIVSSSVSVNVCVLYTDTCPNSLNLLVICPLEDDIFKVFTIFLWRKLFWLFFIWKHLSPWRSTETSLISLQPEQNHAYSTHTIHCTRSSIYYSNNYLGQYMLIVFKSDFSFDTFFLYDVKYIHIQNCYTLM